MKNTPCNDNDENSALPFETLGAIVARLVEGTENHEEQSDRDRPEDNEAKRKEDDQRRYVAQRLREIERFERQASGDKPRR